MASILRPNQLNHIDTLGTKKEEKNLVKSFAENNFLSSQVGIDSCCGIIYKEWQVLGRGQSLQERETERKQALKLKAVR